MVKTSRGRVECYETPLQYLHTVALDTHVMAEMATRGNTGNTAKRYQRFTGAAARFDPVKSEWVLTTFGNNADGTHEVGKCSFTCYIVKMINMVSSPCAMSHVAIHSGSSSMHSHVSRDARSQVLSFSPFRYHGSQSVRRPHKLTSDTAPTPASLEP